MKTKLSLALMALAAAAPATASAASPAGTVLRIEPGGKVISIVTANGRVSKVRLNQAAPRGTRVGSNVTIAGGRAALRGAAKAVKLRAVVAGSGRSLKLLAPDGSALATVTGPRVAGLAATKAGQVVAVRLSISAKGAVSAAIAAPGDYTDPYADPYVDPVTPPVIDPTACPTPTVAAPLRVIAIDLKGSRIMVQDQAGARSKYVVPAATLDTVRRGMLVNVVDANADGTAESVTAAERVRGRVLEGTVAWIDTDWGAFGLDLANGRNLVVDASACQLGQLTEGAAVAVTVTRDSNGEVVATKIEDGSATTTSGDGEDSGDDSGDDNGDNAGDNGSYGNGDNAGDNEGENDGSTAGGSSGGGNQGGQGLGRGRHGGRGGRGWFGGFGFQQ